MYVHMLFVQLRSSLLKLRAATSWGKRTHNVEMLWFSLHTARLFLTWLARLTLKSFMLY